MESYNCPGRRVRVESHHAEVTSHFAGESEAAEKRLRLLLDFTALIGVEMAQPENRSA